MSLSLKTTEELEALLIEVQEELRRRESVPKIIWLPLARVLRTASPRARYEAECFPIKDEFLPYHVVDGKLYEVGDTRPLDPSNPDDRAVLEERFRFLCDAD